MTNFKFFSVGTAAVPLAVAGAPALVRQLTIQASPANSVGSFINVFQGSVADSITLPPGGTVTIGPFQSNSIQFDQIKLQANVAAQAANVMIDWA